MPPDLQPDRSLLLREPLPLIRHPAAVYLRLLGDGSRTTMEQSLNTIAYLLTGGEGDLYTLNWAALRYEQTCALQCTLVSRYAPATAKKMMCALRRVLHEAKKLGLMTGDDYERAIELPSIKESGKVRGRALSGDEIAALIRVCRQDTSNHGVRDLALIGILRGAGLRRTEMVGLKVTDYDRIKGSLNIVAGKWGKDRLVYLPPVAISFLDDWLRVRGDWEGALICPVFKNGRVERRHMISHSVFVILRKRAIEAGVKDFSPHDFRRTFCSDLLDAGIDIVTVQKLAGHASPITTARYDRRGEETKRQAVQKLGFS